MHSVQTSSSKQAIARNFNRAATTYDSAAIIQQEIGKRLLERLEFIKIDPTVILDLGSGTGFISSALEKKYPKAHLVNLDLAEGMVNFSKKNHHSFNQSYICGDGEFLPLNNHSIDFVFSNCALHWFFNPQKVLEEICRILKPEGLLLFSSFGPDTLKELGESFATLDQDTHINTFIDMHDLGDMLLQTKLSDPVMDMECLRLTYKNITGLIQDLKLTGAGYVYKKQKTGLSPKNTLDKLKTAYEYYRDPTSLLPATFEVIYGHAWATVETMLHTADEEGVIRIPLTHVQHL